MLLFKLLYSRGCIDQLGLDLYRFSNVGLTSRAIVYLVRSRYYTWCGLSRFH